MATPQRKVAQGPIRVDYPVGKLLAESAGHKGRADQDDFTRALEIGNVLQTSLEVDRIIDMFSHEVQSMVAHDGLHYRLPDEKYAHSVGIKTTHSCTYNLMVGSHTLGELTFTRKKRFSTRETLMIEHLLCSIVYPLRNALMYRHALEAALRDPLTGVNNRAAMEIAVNREIDLARRHGTALSMIAIDIDRFKSVNDSYGHIAGDCVIKAVANTVSSCIRSSDILFRYGGEEFAVVLSNTGAEGAILLAERIRQAIERKKYEFNQDAIGITVSQGVACLSQEDESQSLFMRADNALYMAKAEGRNCVKFTDQN